jgi:hypothetical protein
MRRRLTFANVTALLALFFALSAGSYAAITLPKNSVTSKQVKDHSLLKNDFKSGQLQRGPQGIAGAPGITGPTGPAGPAGPQGLAGVLGLTVVESTPVTYASGGYGGSNTAQCPAGTTVVGTGFNAGLSFPGFVKKFGTFVGGFFDNESLISTNATVQAICAQLPPGATAARATASSAVAHRQFKAAVARMTARLDSRPDARAACTRARILGQSKCIARGQYCIHTTRANRDYHRYGLHCGKRDANGRYHLT